MTFVRISCYIEFDVCVFLHRLSFTPCALKFLFCYFTMDFLRSGAAFCSALPLRPPRC